MGTLRVDTIEKKNETEITISSPVSIDEAVVINESGADKNFRVEASGQANAISVEGGNGNIGFGRAASVDTAVFIRAGLGSNTAALVIDDGFSTLFQIDRDGEARFDIGPVGIGTIPAANRFFDVEANTTSYMAEFNNTNTNGYGMQIKVNNTNANEILSVEGSGGPIFNVKADGNIAMGNLPTSNPGAGQLWVDTTDSYRIKLGT